MRIADILLPGGVHVNKPALLAYMEAREILSLTDDDYGGLGDGLADNSSAISDWLDDVIDTGSLGWVPQGAYNFNTEIAKENIPLFLSLRGASWSTRFVWTGATAGAAAVKMLRLEGSGNGGLVVSDMTFDCNNKATCALEHANWGHCISLERLQFQNGKKNTDNNVAMLNGRAETHGGHMSEIWFFSGDAIGWGHNILGEAGGMQAWNLHSCHWQGINNFAGKGKHFTGLTMADCYLDGQIADADAKGFELDACAHIDIQLRYAENIVNDVLSINPATAHTAKEATGRIRNSVFAVSGATSGRDIYVGYTEGLTIDGNSCIGHNSPFIHLSANSRDTILGYNKCWKDSTGTLEQTLEAFVTADAGATYCFRTGYTHVHSTARLIDVTGATAHTDWQNSAAVSTENIPDIPPTWRTLRVRAEIMSPTVGARLYLGTNGQTPEIGDVLTDSRIHYVEAQTANRWNTAEFTIAANIGDFPSLDTFRYVVQGGGAADVAYRVTVVGYESLI